MCVVLRQDASLGHISTIVLRGSTGRQLAVGSLSPSQSLCHMAQRALLLALGIPPYGGAATSGARCRNCFVAPDLLPEHADASSRTAIWVGSGDS